MAGAHPLQPQTPLMALPPVLFWPHLPAGCQGARDWLQLTSDSLGNQAASQGFASRERLVVCFVKPVLQRAVCWWPLYRLAALQQVSSRLQQQLLLLMVLLLTRELATHQQLVRVGWLLVLLWLLLVLLQPLQLAHPLLLVLLQMQLAQLLVLLLLLLVQLLCRQAVAVSLGQQKRLCFAQRLQMLSLAMGLPATPLRALLMCPVQQHLCCQLLAVQLQMPGWALLRSLLLALLLSLAQLLLQLTRAQ